MAQSSNRHSSSPGFPSGSKSKRDTIPGLGVDVPELQQARGLWQANRFDESLALFEAAVRKYPQNLLALVDTSRALGARFEITKAEAILDRLAQLGARNPQLLYLAGQSYRMIFRPDKAIRCFERVLKITRQLPDAQLELAVMYERRHRISEALELIENCLKAEPDYLEAALFKGRLLRRLKDLAGAESLFRQMTENENAHPFVRAQAWAEIASMLDALGDYASAMQAMLQSKALLVPGETALLKESEALQRHLNHLKDSLTRDHFRKWAEAGKAFPFRRMAVLTSFPRSGTTLLEQVLDSHPDVVSSDEREAFARDIFPSIWRSKTHPLPTIEAFEAIPMANLAAQRERYLTYMTAALNESIGERVHLDKNPSLTLLIPGMLRLFPETRLLIALRDPRDVIVSCFMQYLPLNTNSVCYLTLERTAARYANDMGTWLRLRELIDSPWLEVRYENCVRQLDVEARRALDFLDLPWSAEVLEYRERLKTKAVASPTYEAVSKPLYSSAIGRWRNYEKFVEPCLNVLGPCIKALGYTG
jgi:thioredoxin-like negative regulator of GroEL